MNKRFIPTYLASSVYAIPSSFYRKEGIEILLLDLDNTLASHHTRKADAASQIWVKKMKEAGLSLYIVSNNTGRRVKEYAQSLGVEALSGLAKPFSCKLRRLLKKKGFAPQHCVLIGDQLLTDVLAANGAHLRSILSEPLSADDPPWTKVNRFFERRKRRAFNANPSRYGIKEAL